MLAVTNSIGVARTNVRMRLQLLNEIMLQRKCFSGKSSMPEKNHYELTHYSHWQWSRVLVTYLFSFQVHLNALLGQNEHYYVVTSCWRVSLFSNMLKPHRKSCVSVWKNNHTYKDGLVPWSCWCGQSEREDRPTQPSTDSSPSQFYTTFTHRH